MWRQSCSRSSDTKVTESICILLLNSLPSRLLNSIAWFKRCMLQCANLARIRKFLEILLPSHLPFSLTDRPFSCPRKLLKTTLATLRLNGHIIAVRAHGSLALSRPLKWEVYQENLVLLYTHWNLHLFRCKKSVFWGVSWLTVKQWLFVSQMRKQINLYLSLKIKHHGVRCNSCSDSINSTINIYRV